MQAHNSQQYHSLSLKTLSVTYAPIACCWEDDSVCESSCVGASG